MPNKEAGNESGFFSLYSLKHKLTRREFLIMCGVALTTLIAACTPKRTLETPTTISQPSVIPPTLPKETPIAMARNTPTIVATRFTPEPTATPIITPKPTSTVEAKPTVRVENQTEKAIKKLIKPFWEEAKKMRLEKAKNDKEWSRRVDAELNSNRVNFLLFGYGKSIEPPNPNLIDVGSHTIISVDVNTGQIDVVSFTHDIWDPGINRYRGDFGKKNSAAKIDQAFFEGKKKGEDEGFKLMGNSVEELSGLSIDYQIAFQDDEVFTDLIDGVFGGIEIDIPQAFDVLGYYYKGQRKGDGHFNAGVERMTGERVCQYIKTVPKVPGKYDNSLEHNVRKSNALVALFKASINQMKNIDFQLKMLRFLGLDILQKKIAHNFSWDLAINAVKSVFGDQEISGQLSTGSNQNETIKFKTSTYIVDPAFGDGGVQWVLAQAAVNPVIDDFVKKGVFPSRIDAQGNLAIDMATTIGGNPNDNSYWGSTRKLVKTTLTRQ